MEEEKPAELTISLNMLIHRIAWYELHDQHGAAEALRQLAADYRPALRVDEVLVRQKMAELRLNRKTPLQLD